MAIKFEDKKEGQGESPPQAKKRTEESPAKASVEEPAGLPFAKPVRPEKKGRRK